MNELVDKNHIKTVGKAMATKYVLDDYVYELEFPVQGTDNYKSFFILCNSFYTEIPLNSNNLYISFKQK